MVKMATPVILCLLIMDMKKQGKGQEFRCELIMLTLSMKGLGAIIPSLKEVVCTNNSWSMHFINVEEDHLDYIRANQKDLRTKVYRGIHEAVLNGDVEGFSTGKIIVPSSLTGSPRYMINNYQDAMAICRAYGNPDLFITFTCNVN